MRALYLCLVIVAMALAFVIEAEIESVEKEDGTGKTLRLRHSNETRANLQIIINERVRELNARYCSSTRSQMLLFAAEHAVALGTGVGDNATTASVYDVTSKLVDLIK